MSVTQLTCQIMIPMKTKWHKHEGNVCFYICPLSSDPSEREFGGIMVSDHAPFSIESWLSILTLLMFLTLATKAPVWAVALPLASFPSCFGTAVYHTVTCCLVSLTLLHYCFLTRHLASQAAPSVCYTLPDTSHLKWPPCLPASCSPSTQFQETLRDAGPFPKGIDNAPISSSRLALITFLYSYVALIFFIMFSLLGKTI